MNEPTTREIVQRAWQAGMVVPAFNIPYLPMMAPGVAALRDTKAFGLVMAARLEWVKFEARSIEAVRDEYLRVGDPRHTRLHLDHVPVIDEDDLRVDYMGDIRRAIDAGYESVMIDGSRLPLEENIRRTREVAEAAHAAGIPVEAELGAVMGHEAGPLPPYEELFRTKQGFTSPEEAAEFAEESGADWLSVAIGNIHGAVSAAKKNEKKLAARIDLEHLGHINNAAGVPLVLHGGTGIAPELIRASARHGIAKVNVATAIRQPYEQNLKESQEKALQAVYDTMLVILKEELRLENTARLIAGNEE